MNRKKDDVNKEITAETKVGFGVMLASVAVAVISAMYIYDSATGKRYRREMSDWMSAMREDIESNMKKLKRVDKDVYFSIVDDVVSQYQKMDEVDAEDLVAFAKELKGHYKTLRRAMEEEKPPVTEGGEKKEKADKDPATRNKREKVKKNTGKTQTSTPRTQRRTRKTT